MNSMSRNSSCWGNSKIPLGNRASGHNRASRLLHPSPVNPICEPRSDMRQGHWGQVVLASQEDRPHARTLSSVPKKGPDRPYRA
jgi:hypothetical protein